MKTPTNAYMEKYVEIQSKLAELQSMVDDHFGDDPDEINWGHVGDLNRIDRALDELIEVGS